MNKQNVVTSGVVAFSNITATEIFNGKDTERYSVVINMDEVDANKLRDLGVKVKEYKPEGGEARPQRKFSSKFHIPVVDLEDRPHNGEIPFGSTVRLLWTTGPAHPEHGVPTYLNRIRLVEMAEGDVETPDEF